VSTDQGDHGEFESTRVDLVMTFPTNKRINGGVRYEAKGHLRKWTPDSQLKL